ncbi:MAG: WbqC family protein, partial [Bacteroidota bacterium]
MCKGILLETQYFPPIQYFSKLLAYPTIFLEQHENYLKGSYRNRCHIVGANGMQRLSIPLQRGKNEQLPIREVRISYSENWQNQHWTSIRSAYGRAPFFEYFADDVERFFKKKYHFLFDLNEALLAFMLTTLQI